MIVLKHKYNYKSFFEWFDDSGEKHYNVTLQDDSYDNISETELNEYYNQNKETIDNQEKLEELRKIRDQLLSRTSIPIILRNLTENEAVADGVPGQPTLTKAQYKQWLIYWKELRDLPETYDMTRSLDDIRNMVGFPVMPGVGL